MSILKNLEEDVQTLDEAGSRFELTLVNIERLFQEKPVPDDSLAFVSTRATGNISFIPITSAFDRSLSSGKFDLIQDESIAQLIQRLYAFDYNTAEESSENLDRIQNSIQDLSQKYEAFDLRPFERSSSYYDRTFVLPWNIKNLKRRNQDPHLKSALKHFYTNVILALRFYENLKQRNIAVQQ